MSYGCAQKITVSKQNSWFSFVVICKSIFGEKNLPHQKIFLTNIFYLSHSYPTWILYPRSDRMRAIVGGERYCHTRIQLGIQSKLNSCKYHLASWATKWHDYVHVDHPPNHHLTVWDVSVWYLEGVWRVSWTWLEAFWINMEFNLNWILALSMLCGVPTQIVPPIYKVYAVSPRHGKCV